MIGHTKGFRLKIEKEGFFEYFWYLQFLVSLHAMWKLSSLLF